MRYRKLRTPFAFSAKRRMGLPSRRLHSSLLLLIIALLCRHLHELPAAATLLLKCHHSRRFGYFSYESEFRFPNCRKRTWTMTSSSTTDIRRHYQDHLDPHNYWEEITIFENLNEEWPFYKQCWADMFKDPKLHGTSLLEIGSGATVHNVAPASGYYSHIVLSDFNNANCEALKKWLRGDPDCLDWSKHLRQVARTTGYEDEEKGVQDIVAKIRQNVKAVIHCDVLADQVVAEEYKGPYDVVITCYTVECACPDYESFKSAWKKIGKLLKPGGYLLSAGFLMGGRWKCGDHIFPYLKVNREQITRALEEAGFGEFEWKTMKKTTMEFYYEFDSLYVLKCLKVRE